MTIADLEPHRDAVTLEVFRWLHGAARENLTDLGHADVCAGQLVDLVFGAIAASMAGREPHATPQET